jgi:hypothetical protein
VDARAFALGAPDARATGLSVQVARDSGRMVRGALRGTALTAVLLLAVLRVGLGSWRDAWLALAPTSFPCVVLYGAMGALGRPLSFATAMIGSVLLGLIVDDTIHVLHHYRAARRTGSSPADALEAVLARTGRAVVVTSVALAVGFGATLLGRLETTVEFGAMASFTILAALAADLVLLPALLLRGAPSADPSMEPARG